MIGYLLLNPFIAVGVTAAIFVAVLLLTRPAPSHPSLAETPVARSLATTARRFGATSAAITLAAFVFTNGAPLARLTPPWAYRWWLYLPSIVPVVAALVVLLVILSTRRSAPTAAVAPVQRRDWWSFSERRDLVAGAVIVIGAVLTCVIAGRGSEWMIIRLPNGGGYSDFFGWAYGLPFLGGTILAALLAVACLRANARPAYASPETSAAEVSARKAMASVIVRAAAVALLIPLGTALLDIGFAASSRGGFGIPGGETYMFNLGFSSLSETFLLLGRACQVVGVVVVFLLFVGGSRQRKFSRRERPAVIAEGSR